MKRKSTLKPKTMKNSIKAPKALKNPMKTQKKGNFFHIKKTLKQYPNNLRMYSFGKLNIFDNKNILCLTSEGYTIYDNKFKIIKRKKIYQSLMLKL